MEEFLHWIKDLEADLHGRGGCFNLMGSGIREPTAELLGLLQEHLPALQARLQSPNSWGHPALVERLRYRYRIPADRDVLVTGGATAAMWLVCYGLLSGARGDRVIVEDPVYEPLRAIPGRLGVAVDVLQRRAGTGHRIDPDELASLVRPETRLVLLTNLHNPSSACLGDDLLRRAMQAVRTRNPEVNIVVDETFHDFVLDKQPSVALLDPGFIAINTLTKVYGLGLLRCGWIVAAPEVIRTLRTPWVDAYGIGSRLTEVLSSVVLDRMELFEAHWKGVLAGNRDVARAVTAPLFAEGRMDGEVPEDGVVWFPRITGCADTDALTRNLAGERKVFVVPGSFFGAPGHIRIGLGGDPGTLREGLARLVEGIRAHMPAANEPEA